MSYAVECATEVGVQHPLSGAPTVEPVEAGANGVMDTASGAKTVAGRFEMSFPGRFQRGLDHLLANPGLDRRAPDRSLLAIGLRDVGEAHRLRAITTLL